MSAAAEWRALLQEFPARCVTSAALRRRKRWRKKCARLCAAQNGLPPEVRRAVRARKRAAEQRAARNEKPAAGSWLAQQQRAEAVKQRRAMRKKWGARGK